MLLIKNQCRRPGISTNRIILDIENDPNLDCHTVQWSSQAGKILNSEKQPVTSHRTTFAKYEKEKLFSEIDCAIEKSKVLNSKAGQRNNTGSDLIEIDCPEPLTHRDLTLPRYRLLIFNVRSKSGFSSNWKLL